MSSTCKSQQLSCLSRIGPILLPQYTKSGSSDRAFAKVIYQHNQTRGCTSGTVLKYGTTTVVAKEDHEEDVSSMLRVRSILIG